MKTKLKNVGTAINCKNLGENLADEGFGGIGDPGFEVKEAVINGLRVDYKQVEYNDREVWDEEEEHITEQTIPELRVVPIYIDTEFGRAFFAGPNKLISSAISKINTIHDDPISFKKAHVDLYPLFEALISESGWSLKGYKLEGYKPREGIEGDFDANPTELEAAKEEIEENRHKLERLKMLFIERGRVETKEVKFTFRESSMNVPKDEVGTLGHCKDLLRPLQHTNRQQQINDG